MTARSEPIEEIPVHVVVRESPLGTYLDLQTVARTPEEARKVAVEEDKWRDKQYLESYRPVSIRPMLLVGRKK